MATPSILATGSTSGAGTAGAAKVDAVATETITLSDAANAGASTYSWELWTMDGSAVTLSDANTNAATFTAAAGESYLAFVTTDGVKSYSVNAAGERVSSQGGVAVQVGGYTLHVPGETDQFGGWNELIDEVLSDYANGLLGGGGGGQSNTASNVGTAGVGVFKQKTGVDLEFKKINAGSAKVTVTDDTGNDELDIDIAEAQLDHGTIGGLSDDDHTQYTLAAGTRAFTGDIDLGTNAITNVGNVDGRDVSADGTKLDGIEASATDDQTGAEIKAAYEGEADTNAFTDAEQTKLSGIETAADVTDATNVAAAGAVMDSDISEGEGFIRKTGAGAYEGIKSNLGAAVDPTVSDDSSAGYAAGSVWINTTTPAIFQAISVGVGAADWNQLDAAGGGASDHGALTGLSDDDHTQYMLVAGTRAMTGNIDLGNFNIENPGKFDGVLEPAGGFGTKDLGSGARAWATSYLNGGQIRGGGTFSGAKTANAADGPFQVYTGTGGDTFTMSTTQRQMIRILHGGSGTLTIAAGAGDSLDSSVDTSLAAGESVTLWRLTTVVYQFSKSSNP